MVGKQIVGKGFGGCIRYLLNRDEATILAAEGLHAENAATITRDFNIQRKMNPNLGKAVGHMVLSWSSEDKALLTPEIMAERAKEYLKLMGIENTQYVIVQHTDKQHPHLHIVYNRVDNNGRTISDSNNYKANIKACKIITEKYGYHMGEGKEKVNRENLKGKEKVRYEIYDAISKAIKTSTNWKAFESTLKSKGIEIQFKHKGKTKEIQGISFSKGDVKFKGSAIDSSFSYSKLNIRIDANLAAQPLETKSLAEQIREKVAIRIEAKALAQNNEGYFPPGWFDFVQDLGNVIADDIDDEEYKRKKRLLSR